MISAVTAPEAFHRAFEAALNAGDLDALTRLYDPAAVLRVQPDVIRSGAAAVRAEMQQLIESGAVFSNSLRHCLECGDTALILVDYVLRLTPPNGSATVLTGTAANVIRRDPTQGWRMIVANPLGTD